MSAPRWFLLAAGKAAGPMIGAVLDAVPKRPARALCVALGSQPGLPAFVETYEGGHPAPNEGSVAAGRAALGAASEAGPDDVLLVLLSGGASALLALPAGPLTLVDKQQTTARLLKAGADIHALNTVRKHLSGIKGGRLAAASAGRTICLAISDVVGDDPSVIGSGPTVGDATTMRDALQVLDRYGGRSVYPSPVVALLERGVATGAHESPKPGSASLSRVETRVIAGRMDALRGARAEAAARGYEVHVYEEPVVGEARVAALAHLGRVLELAAKRPGRTCVLSAGETTVTVTGAGRGGRNQEFALACAPALANLPRPTVVLSAGTDGIDGPTDAAGAVVDTSTMARAALAGLDLPAAFLARNDAYRYFASLGDLLLTGPTGTNVGDVQVVLMA